MSECNEIIYKSQIKCSLTILKLSFIVKTFRRIRFKAKYFQSLPDWKYSMLGTLKNQHINYNVNL